jgi:hypothetical protein
MRAIIPFQLVHPHPRGLFKGWSIWPPCSLSLEVEPAHLKPFHHRMNEEERMIPLNTSRTLEKSLPRM